LPRRFPACRRRTAPPVPACRRGILTERRLKFLRIWNGDETDWASTLARSRWCCASRWPPIEKPGVNRECTPNPAELAHGCGARRVLLVGRLARASAGERQLFDNGWRFHLGDVAQAQLPASWTRVGAKWICPTTGPLKAPLQPEKRQWHGVFCRAASAGIGDLPPSGRDARRRCRSGFDGVYRAAPSGSTDPPRFASLWVFHFRVRPDPHLRFGEPSTCLPCA